MKHLFENPTSDEAKTSRERVFIIIIIIINIIIIIVIIVILEYENVTWKQEICLQIVLCSRALLRL